MQAARLYGAKDIRVEETPEVGAPGPGEVVLEIKAVGICGSDLHTFEDGRIGDTRVASPLVLGHEFGGVIKEVGEGALDGEGRPLRAGQRVAVDPATPCWSCEMCELGHPNLCLNLSFYGLYPDHGALRNRMIVGGRNCFPVPDSISDAGLALLETLGVAIHAVDLGKLKVARSVAVVGSGPIGLMITKLAALSGARPVYAFDKFPWRTERALEWGATHSFCLGDGGEDGDPVAWLMKETGGRGADVVFEAAWADESIAQAAEMARLGGRLVLVGIPGNDTLTLKHSVARRKGLTILMSRRMKHTYPRAIRLATEGGVDLDALVSHRFELAETPRAFQLNLAYPEGLHKVIVEV